MQCPTPSEAGTRGDSLCCSPKTSFWNQKPRPQSLEPWFPRPLLWGLLCSLQKPGANCQPGFQAATRRKSLEGIGGKKTQKYELAWDMLQETDLQTCGIRPAVCWDGLCSGSLIIPHLVNEVPDKGDQKVKFRKTTRVCC